MGILAIEHIVKTPGVCGGEPRIDGTRMRVQDVVIYYQAKMTVEEICEGFDLTPGQVHAALSYYSDHREEIEGYMREEVEFADKYLADGHMIDSEELEAQINARRKK